MSKTLSMPLAGIVALMILFGLVGPIAWNLNESPHSTLYTICFLSLVVFAIGIAGLRNWARIMIIISLSSLIILCLYDTILHSLLVREPVLAEECYMLLAFISPFALIIFYLCRKKTRERFKE